MNTVQHNPSESQPQVPAWAVRAANKIDAHLFPIIGNVLVTHIDPMARIIASHCPMAEVVESLKVALVYIEHELDELNKQIGPHHSCGTPDSNCDCLCMDRSSVGKDYHRVRSLLSKLEAAQ